MATPRFFEKHRAIVERPAMEYECNAVRMPKVPSHRINKLTHGIAPKTFKPLIPTKEMPNRSVKILKNFGNEARSNNRPTLGSTNIVAKCANAYAALIWVRDRDKSRQRSFKNGLKAAVRPSPLNPSNSVTTSKTDQAIFHKPLRSVCG